MDRGLMGRVKHDEDVLGRRNFDAEYIGLIVEIGS